MRNLDLNKLLAFAQDKGIAFELFYSECTNSADIRTVSPAPAEEYLYKNCSCIDSFIDAWENNLRKQLQKPNKV